MEKAIPHERHLRMEYLSIVNLRPDPQNPRVHSDKQVRQIARSIQTFGFNVPVLVDENSQVIAGHGRLLAAQLLKMENVPAIRIENLSEAQRRAFLIADNRLTEKAAWDERLLAEQFEILSTLDLDFSLDITGFEMAEIDTTIESLVPASSGKDDPSDVIPEPKTQHVVTQSGDLWILDRHRVHCGDARNRTAYSTLMENRRAAMVFTDPPYNDPIDGYVTGFGKVHHPEFKMASGEMSPSEFTAFLTIVLAQLGHNSADGALHFVCMDWRHSEELLAAARSVYSEFKNICVWVKENAGQGSLYRSQHELIFVFKRGKSSHRNNIQLGQFGRYRTNVWNYRRATSLGRTTEEGRLAESHPTVKPVELVADAILDCTARSDIVIDPFVGSGTTVIAAERTGRICYGMELNPIYIDTIVRRWQSFTGQTALHAITGKTFRAIDEEKNGRDAG
ncbi:MAG: DNA methyltransferase [Candidatus Acidiferrales bacterium]